MIKKENFRNNGQYDDEDAAYVEFKRCESKAKLSNYRDNKLKQYILQCLKPKYNISESLEELEQLSNTGQEERNQTQHN